jgi:hypothetical protein
MFRVVIGYCQRKVAAKLICFPFREKPSRVSQRLFVAISQCIHDPMIQADLFPFRYIRETRREGASTRGIVFQAYVSHWGGNGAYHTFNFFHLHLQF